MAKKINNLFDYVPWSKEGKKLPLPKDKARPVRIEFIAQSAAEFRVFTEDDLINDREGRLFGVLPQGGQELYEFWADGNIAIGATTDGDLSFLCSENDVVWFRQDDEVKFTKPYERPLVDPAITQMRLAMMQNMQAMEERINQGIRRLKAAEPPVATTVQEKRVAPNADGEPEAEAPSGKPDGKPAGKKPPAGAEKPGKTPAAGSGLQPAESGQGD